MIGMDNNRKFRSIFSTILSVPEDQVNDALSPDAVDTWDSLNHINLIGALEQEFGLTFGTDELVDSQSVGRLKALLVTHGVEL